MTAYTKSSLERNLKEPSALDSPLKRRSLGHGGIPGAMRAWASIRFRASVAELDALTEPDYHEPSTYDWNPPEQASEFIGLPMRASYAQDCAVCGGRIARGDCIFFNYTRGASRRAAHVGCGRAVCRGESL